ncbi:peptidase cysteine/serine trypsin-like domain-containing protein (plasmid) [Rhizobium etli bv. phaseoli str. IE4803]|nr:peptidase cysteine/serine trypsin-like domain-containing protein [Rhizobium etli bv. phaseoli str. IE4803]
MTASSYSSPLPGSNRSVRADARQVPFISDWRDPTPFADVPSDAGVTNAQHMLEGWAQTRQKALRDTRLEAQVGVWNTVPAALLDLLARYRRTVARIVVPGGQLDYRNMRQEGGWTGTGFLVGSNILLTNHHVLNSVAVAGAAVAEFDYEWPSDKLFANVGTSEPPVVRFELSPSRLFVTSPVNAGGLDYSFVWISEKASAQFGTVPMERGSFMISQYEPTFVIHHPQGRLKEVSLDDTELLAVNSLNILYAADTDYGSSGACVFNRNGRLVALHHARQTGDELKRLYPDVAQQLVDGRTVTVGNEGIKISAIAIDLELRIRRGESDAEGAAEILKGIEGSDTLTGIFGALGRQSRSESHAARVREIYRASDQDIDIGFWSLRWLFDGTSVSVKIEDVVTAMADLNQDVWCLTDATPAAAADIVKGLGERFGEKFELQFAEPDAQIRQIATAVIWRSKMVTCTRSDWPTAVASAWARVVAAEPGGNVIQPPPGQFRIAPCDAAAGGTTKNAINIVPLGLRVMHTDETRRRLISKLLARAIEMTVAERGDGSDWIIGGDLEPPLAEIDCAALRALQYKCMAAVDQRRGSALSYLRAPASAVRNVFVTADLELIGNERDFFTSVQNRTVEKFVRKLTDNRPAVLRLSLEAVGERTSDQALNDMLDSILGSVSMSADPGLTKTLPGDASPLRRDTALQANSVAPNVAGGSWFASLVWRGLDKPKFLSSNRQPFARLLAEVATRQKVNYADVSPLTEIDLWVITFAEAGLGRGGVDPGFVHSNGEIGLYPLPNNITFWIGSDAPAWNRPMPIEVNIESYAFYLSQIRNKWVTTASGRILYRDLFRVAGIAGTPERGARLLAGVVHGYFVSRNYRGGRVPFDRILSGIAQDEPVDRILSGTDYVHAGTTILTNRQRNIDAAIAAFRAAGPP